MRSGRQLHGSRACLLASLHRALSGWSLPGWSLQVGLRLSWNMTRLLPSFVAVLISIACGGAFEGGDDEPGGQAGTAGSAGSGSGGSAASGSAGAPNGSCQHGDDTYADGDSWAVACNTCTCNDGEVSCTTIECG